ncbi:LptF/LptG family permease [Chlamydiifrater phoenicopteri]|uniref:LptF/LptG family permease n=1 Tax=Chlamydiifrater phoenicopteri TaxID=2681469 RepID=UPI001BCAEAAC|nr:LptF/LptG family permease [Chlamydiifrater phoenicopteri]
MPLLWKLLILRFLKTTFLCSLSLIFISIIGSLQEIVSLIAKNISYITVFKLSIYQIPYLLPFIIPVSCFVSSFSIFRKLSDNNQITFLRSSGASQSLIIFPLLVTAGIICCVNFYTCSELASICRYRTCKEIANIAMTSPALLLQTIQKNETNRIFIAVDNCRKNTFNDVIVALKRDGEISDIGIIKNIIPNTAKDTVSANKVLIISKIPNSLKHESDSQEIYTETIDSILIPKVTSTLFAGKSYMKTRTDYLSWKTLLKSCKQNKDSKELLPEIFRRLAIGSLCITLTYSGIVLGTYKPRFKKRFNPFVILPILTLTLLIIGKNTKSVAMAFLLFVLPQLSTWIIFAILSYRETRGQA